VNPVTRTMIRLTCLLAWLPCATGGAGKTTENDGKRNGSLPRTVVEELTIVRAADGARETPVDADQQAEFAVLCQAQSFLDLHADALAAINRAPARAELDRLISTIREEAAAQVRAVAAAESLTMLKNEIHARLRREIGRLRALAEARPEDLVLLQKFKPLSRNTSDPSLTAHANGMADGAEQYRAVFEREGYGDFVGQLRALIGEFQLVISERNNSQSRRNIATRALRDSFQRAWKIIGLLAALFEPGDAGHRRLLTAWKVETLHAPRALPKPPEVPRLTAAGAPMLSLPAGDAPAPGTAMVSVAKGPATHVAPDFRGFLRLIARLFGKESAA
jgi:hypothetical protein